MNHQEKHKQMHECDLFLLSSHTPYYADKSLEEFAKKGQRNIHGWGIGSYHDGKANVVVSEVSAVTVKCKTEESKATKQVVITEKFKSAILSTCSPLIIGHLRLASRGNVKTENNHPFKLNFLGYDWLLAHNGSAVNPDRLVSINESFFPKSDNDSPRVFEYLRKHIIDYYLTSQKHSLIEACRSAYQKLLEADQGKFNIILSNGYLSFVLVHWRDFYMLRREKAGGDVILISTIKLTKDEEWVKIKLSEFTARGKQAKMLVFSGNSLIYNGDIPK